MDIQAYNKAIEFVKNRRKIEPIKQGISNLYVIERVDKDGNVLETKFGENLMTDYGFHRHFVDKVSWPTNLYVGDGVPAAGHFSQDSQTLESIITTRALTNSTTVKDYACPFYYDTASSSSEFGGLVTVFCQYMKSYMDYTNSTYEITEDEKLIYEFGIGENDTKLWTHSRVYNSAGTATHIMKRDNERLYFTIFLCVTYYESLIMNGWNDAGHDAEGKYGTYTVITTPERMFNYMDPTNTKVYSFQRDNRNNVAITVVPSSTSIETTYITRTQVLSNLILETSPGDGKLTTGNGYIDGFVNDSPGFCIVEREELSTPESFDVILHPSTPYEDGMSAAFGTRDLYRFTQLEDVTSFAMFDYVTNDWTNTSLYVNDPLKWYDETPLMSTFGKPIYYISNNTIQTLYVHQNINQLDGITSITSGHLIVYMATKYWDVSTWVNITDILHIPSAYKNYKYILTSENSVDLRVERERDKFHIVPKTGTSVTTYNSFDKVLGVVHTVDNFQYGWYKGNKKVYVPDTLTTYTTVSDHSMTWGKWLVDYPNTSTLTIYDMSNVVSQHPSTLTSYTITPAFGVTVSNILTTCFRTDSGTGLICLFNKANSKAVVIDLDSFDGTTFTMNQLLGDRCIMACCVVNTRYVAYIPSDATNTIVIYDCDTSQIYKTLTMPTITGTPSILIGIGPYVWISDGTASNTYYINIETNDYDVCDTYIPWTSSSALYNFKCSHTNDFFVGYNHAESLSSHNMAFAIKVNEPKHIKSLTNFKDTYSQNSLNITLRNVETNASSNTCAMIISSSYQNSYNCINVVMDLGYYFFNTVNTVNLDNVYIDINSSEERRGTMIPYGQFVMVDNRTKTPLEFAMPHKLSGKTKTITTQNHYKSINKEWSTTFTNTPKFNGLPPGTMATL